MKNKFGRLSVVVLGASLLASISTFGQTIQVDEAGFLIPINQVIYEEQNNMAANVTGFATNNFSVSTSLETATGFGTTTVFGEWLAATPFANGQVQAFNFNIYDFPGSAVSDTLHIVLSGLSGTGGDPNNMSISFSFLSDNLSGSPALSALFGGQLLYETGLFISLSDYLPTQFVNDPTSPLLLSFRSEVPEPSALQFGLMSLVSLPFLRRFLAKK
jgi:hypothetical protein